MAVLLDSGFLLASLNSSEAEHEATNQSPGEYSRGDRSAGAGNHRGCLPASARYRKRCRRRLHSSLADSELILETPLAEDYLRCAEILRQYADANLDFVDALIAATAERLNILPEN